MCSVGLINHISFISAEILHNNIAQSQHNNLESVRYLLATLFHGLLPWDHDPCIWHVKMSTPGSTLFCGMDPLFLEYWKDVWTLASGEVPDYFSLKSCFVQCWEQKGFSSSLGEYDWLASSNRLSGGGGEKSTALDNWQGISSPSTMVTSVIVPGPISNSAHSAHWQPKSFLIPFCEYLMLDYIIGTILYMVDVNIIIIHCPFWLDKVTSALPSLIIWTIQGCDA